MLPLLTFASGLIAGAIGVHLLKNAKTPEALKAGADTVGAKAQAGVDRAQSAAREAAISGLSAIERTSASLRTRLAAEPAVPEAAAEPAAAPEALAAPAAVEPETAPPPEAGSEDVAAPATAGEKPAAPGTGAA